MLMVYKGVAHPWLCDVFGHMTTRHYLAMFDDASYHLLSSVFGWPGAIDGDKTMGWVDVRQTLDYKAEVAAGETLEISGGIAKIGTRSIGVYYEMINRLNNEVACTLNGISVLFDLNARKALNIPDDLRALAERHLVKIPD